MHSVATAPHFAGGRPVRRRSARPVQGAAMRSESVARARIRALDARTPIAGTRRVVAADGHDFHTDK